MISRGELESRFVRVLLNGGAAALGMIDRFEGYVFFVDIDMLLFDVFLLFDIFVAFDMFVLYVLCLPLPLFIPLPLEREVVQEFGSRAFFR